MNPDADELNRSVKRLEEVRHVSNKYDAAGCCTKCDGVVLHESWCVMVNKEMEYAFLLAVNPTIITEGDTIELHSLGVLWHSGASENRH